MGNLDRLDKILKSILSLLISRKNSILVARLDNDFYEQNGKRIPFRKFGFANLVEFLQNMPEYFKVEQHNDIHYVRIASEKNKYVSSLIVQQKRKNVKNIIYTPPPLRNTPSEFYIQSSITFNRRIQHNYQRVRLSSDELLHLTQYIKNNPNGVSVDNAVMFAQHLVPHINLSEYNLRSQLRELSHHLILDGNMIYPVQNDNLQDNEAYSQPMKKKLSESPSDSGLPLNTQNIFFAGEEDWVECSSDENDFIPADCNPGNNYMRHVKASELLETDIAQHNMIYEQIDMYKVKNNLENKDMYKAENISEGNDYSTMMSSSKSSTEMKDIKHLVPTEIISDKIKLRLEKLLKKHPDGIWCADLPDIYLYEYKEHLNYTELGFISVREFTSRLPKIFYMTQVNKTSDFLLYSADFWPVVSKTEPTDIAQASNTHTLCNRRDEHNPVRAHCRNAEDDPPIPSEVSPTITKRFASNDVMNYGDNVEKILVTELQCDRKFLEVYVCALFNPNFFWIHLRKNKYRFYRLLDDLHNFYELNKSSYTIAKITLQKGLNCACPYMHRWHRGIIKSVKPDFRVTVFFYDIGTLKKCAPEEVFYLHKKFSYLPAQAIPCSLYNVRPNVGDRWKKSVKAQLVDKIADTLLAASIITVDATNNSMMVVLTDTTEEEDVNINDWLVNERLAQVGQMADTVDMANIMKYVVNNWYQLPTYCFAEESLMPENCCKATSTEEKHEVPSVPSGSTPIYNGNQHQQQPMRSPPRFPPLGKQHVPSALTRNFQNSYSFANASSKTSISGDAKTTTNPFLAEQQFIPNDIEEQLYMSIWNDNKTLQIELIDILNDFYNVDSSLSILNQIQLNKILKIIKEVLLEQKVSHSNENFVKTSLTSNLTSEMTWNDIGSARKESYNFNSETVANRKFNVNNFPTSNSFDINTSDRSSQSNMFYVIFIFIYFLYISFMQYQA